MNAPCCAGSALAAAVMLTPYASQYDCAAAGQSLSADRQPMMAGPCHESYFELRTKRGVETYLATRCPKKHFHRSAGEEARLASHLLLPEPELFHAP